MGGLFGKKKKKPALDQSEKALLDCKMVRDKIKGYIKTLERNEKLKKTKAKESLREKKKELAFRKKNPKCNIMIISFLSKHLEVCCTES